MARSSLYTPGTKDTQIETLSKHLLRAMEEIKTLKQEKAALEKRWNDVRDLVMEEDY